MTGRPPVWGVRVATDYSRGLGHTSRMAVLASELNVRAFFVDPGRAPARLRDLGTPIVVEVSRTSLSRAYQALDLRVIDALVIDSYDVELRAAEHFVAVMDDFGCPSKFAIAALAPGLQGPSKPGPRSVYYAGGPEYALVDQVFQPGRPRVHTDVPTLVISMGGRDSKNIAEKALNGIVRYVPRAECTVILGPNAMHIDHIRSLTGHMGAKLIVGASSAEMNAAYVNADLAVGAGGVSLLERLRVGIPSVVVLQAENQRDQLTAAEQLGVAVLAGSFDHSNLADAIGHSCAELLADHRRLNQLTQRGKQMIDGHGPRRARDFLQDAYARWKELSP